MITFMASCRGVAIQSRPRRVSRVDLDHRVLPSVGRVLLDFRGLAQFPQPLLLLRCSISSFSSIASASRSSLQGRVDRSTNLNVQFSVEMERAWTPWRWTSPTMSSSCSMQTARTLPTFSSCCIELRFYLHWHRGCRVFGHALQCSCLYIGVQLAVCWPTGL